MLKFDLAKCRCDCDGHTYRWSEPRLDVQGSRYRFELLEAIKPCADRFHAELSISKDSYSSEAVRAKVTAKVLFFEKSRANPEHSLEDYVSSSKKWEEIRNFFCWSTTTAKNYQGILHDVFSSVLLIPMTDITTADIDSAVEEKVNRRPDYSYKAATIRTWLKVINRFFVYLTSIHPHSVTNPVRFNGKKIRESRINEKKRIMQSRLSQNSLCDSQEKQMLFAFLEDLKAGEYRSVAAITMLESGRRPIEAGAISSQTCFRPDGEDFFVAPVLETDGEGKIVNEHKNERAKRLVPISPVLATVLEYVTARCKSVGVPETVPYAAKLTFNKDGDLKSAKGFSSPQISRYIHSELINNNIKMTVTVEDGDEDSDENRRAYLLRYSLETNLISFLALERVQYVLGHKRVTSSKGTESKAGDPGFYMSPQVQREIYNAMEARDLAVYGENIIEEIKAFLYSDER